MGLFTTALRRPETYVGHAREALCLAQLALRYAGGVIDSAVLGPQPSGDATHDTPVLLVHGYGHNRSGWFVVERHLRAAGFTSIHTLNYNPLGKDVPTLAAQLGERVRLLRTLSGIERVHVVGHSLGGVMLRWFVQEDGGDELVDSAVTISTPHEGTIAAIAGLGLGPVAADMLPGSWVTKRLARTARASSVRWTAYYSNLDLLVQPAVSAMINHPALAARNVLIKDHGHVSVLLSPRLARSVVADLEHAEHVAGS